MFFDVGNLFTIIYLVLPNNIQLARNIQHSRIVRTRDCTTGGKDLARTIWFSAEH